MTKRIMPESKQILRFFWKDLKPFLTKYKELWDEVDIDDIYRCRDACNIEECWYKRNLDRLDGLTLYNFDDWTICDVCWDNGMANELLSKEDSRTYDIEIDTSTINKILFDKLKLLEIGDNCEKCGRDFYKQDFGYEYWEACSVCEGLFVDEYEDTVKHTSCSTNDSKVFLCDNCINHEGGLAGSQHYG